MPQKEAPFSSTTPHASSEVVSYRQSCKTFARARSLTFELKRLIPARTFELLCYASQIAALVAFPTPALHRSVSSDCLMRVFCRCALRSDVLHACQFCFPLLLWGSLACSAVFSGLFTCNWMFVNVHEHTEASHTHTRISISSTAVLTVLRHA